MVILQVAVPVPLRTLFSYTYPTPLSAGTRVEVPFGSRTLTGFVVGIESSLDSTEGLKPISKALDDKPIVPDTLLHLGTWLSTYYHHPIGETFATMLPTWLRKSKNINAVEQLTADVYWQLSDDGRETLCTRQSIPAPQQDILEKLAISMCPANVLKQHHSPSTIKTLQKKQWIEQIEHIEPEGIHWQSSLSLADKPTANPEQGVAIGALTVGLKAFSITLLEGVTGSGKTEVYLQTIERVLLNGRQVLVLIPEIGLTPQTVARFAQRFNCEIGVLNSQVSDRQRAQIWMKAKQGQLPIVIGTRSAVFTPFHDLGFIIIDEEHDDALKQQDGLRYHARDVAAIRAQRAEIPLLLGSATPSLETLNNALSGRYRHMTLTQRAANAASVRQHLVDIKHQPLTGGLSEPVIAHMRKHLSEGNQVLLFLNRRGYAPVLQCHDCGHVELCHHCDSPMTWHKQQRRMVCHQCDTQRPVPKRCGQCNSTNIIADGLGTEQLEETVKTLFPQYSAVRIDRDSTRKKSAYEDLFNDIHNGKTHILIGTQMLAKGHHFPNVTLVVVIDVDAGLFSADARAPEKLAQLITQISGRAGRAGKRGEMLLQTHNPEHPVLQELINNGYGHVSRLMLAERKALHSPPYATQAIIRAESANFSQAVSVLNTVKQALSQNTEVALVGPMPTLVEKRLNRFRYMLMLRSSDRRRVHSSVNHAIAVLEKNAEAKKLRWSVDVDAIDLT